MDSNNDFDESRAKGVDAQGFIRDVLKFSGYTVMDFGIENHNQEIVNQLKTNYKPETNRLLMSMPDFVVIDDKTKDSCIVEVKSRTFKEYFDMKKSNISMKYGRMKSYLDFWKDATLILVFNVRPYCLCVDFNKINWNIHFKEKFKNKNGKLDESWNFCGIYQIINDKFPKVTQESFKKALRIHRMGN